MGNESGYGARYFHPPGFVTAVLQRGARNAGLLVDEVKLAPAVVGVSPDTVPAVIDDNPEALEAIVVRGDPAVFAQTVLPDTPAQTPRQPR